MPYPKTIKSVSELRSLIISNEIPIFASVGITVDDIVYLPVHKLALLHELEDWQDEDINEFNSGIVHTGSQILIG